MQGTGSSGYNGCEKNGGSSEKRVILQNICHFLFFVKNGFFK